MTSNVLNLPQLSSGNFNNWKFRVLALLEERQVSVALEKEETDFTEEAEKKNFQAKNAKAKSTIIQCITDKHLDLVKDAKTAKAMIKALEDVFERKSIFTKLSLKKRLLTLKLHKNEKLEDHFLNFDSLIRELDSIGSKIDEIDKVCHLLLSLNDDYESVITAIETLNTPITMEFVKSRLLDEELKLKSKGIDKNIRKGSTSEEVSFKVFTCYRCGKEGHKISECDQKVSSQVSYRGRGLRRNSRNRGRYYRSRGQGQSASHAEEQHISFVALNCYELVKNKNTFIMDSGATQHMVMKDLEQYMTNIENLKHEVEIRIANTDIMTAKKRGVLHGICQGRSITINALIVDDMEHNLISVSKLTKQGYKVLFEDHKGKIVGNNFDLYCKEQSGLFLLEIKLEAEPQLCNKALENDSHWHRRLGHLNRNGLKMLGLPVNDAICSQCVEGKATRKTFYSIEKRSKQIGDLIHSDIAGPVTPSTLEGHKYYQVLIDDYSHFLVVKLLKSKNEAEENIKDFIKLIKTQHGAKTKKIRCDNGGEFTSNDFKKYCRSRGIEVQYSLPYSPQQNGTAERMNRTLMNKVRTKFAETNLPRELWGEAIQCSAYELNRSPTSANNGVPPAARWYGRNDLTKLRVFGSRAWFLKLPRESKVEPRAESTIMVGYCGGGYRLWNNKTNEVILSRDVTFDENNVNYTTQSIITENESNNDENMREDSKGRLNEERPVESLNQEIDLDIYAENYLEKRVQTENKQTRTGRTIKTPNYLDEYEVYSAYCLLSANKDPQTFEEAINVKEWRDAIDKELISHKIQETWTEAEMPVNKKPIETKWVFRTKENGSKKARLVAKGFQLEEESIEPLYAPVARTTTIRIMLSHALQNKWTIKQLDVPTAFLNGVLETEIYIYSPEGLETESEVLKLNRALYGLKEAPKVWNTRLNEFATKNGFKRSSYDCCLYRSEQVWMIVYVDDLLLTGNEEKIKEVANLLENEFAVKDMGEVKEFLGMSIKRNEDTMTIKQSNLIDKILKTFNMENCKGIKTPMENGFQIEDEGEIIDVPFRKLIGCLMYLSTSTRPDITFCVSFLSRRLDRPTEQVWKAGKRILRYLKETKDMGLTYRRNENAQEVLAYCDANWGTDKTDRKSVSGGIIFYCNNPVNWFSKKQNCVALSTAESEYISAAQTAQELMNIKGVLEDFKINCKPILLCDNQSAIFMSKSFENTKRVKHIDIKCHYLRDLVTNNVLQIEYVKSSENIADMFTKPLSKDIFVKLREKGNIL